MKLFVLGIIASVAVPLSSFAWNNHEVESIAVVADPVPTPIHEEVVPTPTPTVEPVVEPEPAPVVEAAPALAPQPEAAPIQPVAETIQQRVVRLARAQGITIPVYFGVCAGSSTVDPSIINGCYLPGTYYITITNKAISYGDEWTSCIIRHEYRHYIQDTTGMYQYLNGYISNISLLEDDAKRYAGC